MVASPLFVGSPLANDKRRRRGLKLDPVSHAPSPALELTGENKSFFHFRSQVEDLSAERGLLAIGSADTPRILSAQIWTTPRKMAVATWEERTRV